MIHRRETFFFNTLICVFALFQASCQSSLSLTEDRPPEFVKATDGTVNLGWGFSYKASGSISNGPWEAQDVQEITFGIWESGDDKILSKKIVAVDKSGNFEVRSGYDSKISWSYSVNKLTFMLKNLTIQDQALYGIYVEFGQLDQGPLTHTVRVSIGVSYSGQDEINSNTRNETAYVSDTFNLFYKRSARDRTESFFKYRIWKGKNITIIALGKEQDNENGSCVTDSVLLDECKQRFSLRYFNKTHLSFRIKNVTLQDTGCYTRVAFFLGMNDPERAKICLFVQEKPSPPTPQQGTTDLSHETSDPGAKSGQSDIQFSATILLPLMMVFLIGMVTF